MVLRIAFIVLSIVSLICVSYAVYKIIYCDASDEDHGDNSNTEDPSIGNFQSKLECLWRSYDDNMTCCELSSRKDSLSEIGPPDSIVRGVPSKKNAWPWIALLGVEVQRTRQDGRRRRRRLGSGETSDLSQMNWHCGCALITPHYVITAAHCVEKYEKNPSSIWILLGSLTRAGDEIGNQQTPASSLIIHPEYNRFQHDVALVKLRRPVKFDISVSPICLPLTDPKISGRSGAIRHVSDQPYLGEEAVVAGWGTDSYTGESSENLMEVTLSVINTTQCRQIYSNHLRGFQRYFPDEESFYNSMVCLSDLSNGRRDSCRGDSGGPVALQSSRTSGRHLLIAVTSSSISCGARFPGLYTRIDTHLDWINQYILR